MKAGADALNPLDCVLTGWVTFKPGCTVVFELGKLKGLALALSWAIS